LERVKLKVTICTTNFPRWKGDFRVPFILEAARAISNQGNEVKVLTMHTPGAVTHEYFEKIEVFRAKYLPENLEILQKDASGIPEAWRKGLFQKFATIPFLVRFTCLIGKQAKGSDIIHCNWSLSGLAAYLSKFIHKTPYIITVQGSDIFKTIHIPVVRNVIGLALRKASHIIALSNDLKTATIRFGVTEERITVIPNGVNISQFPVGPKEGRKNQLIFVGSLIERKGVSYLIQAMARLMATHPDTQLVIVGEGKDRDLLEELTSQLGLQENVVFVGTQSQDRVSELLRESRLFILPSIEEGQGVVLVEALASGTPCIGSRVGGISDVITPDVGKLVDAGDVQGLSAAIDSFLIDDALWEAASDNARNRAETDYDWNSLAEKMFEIYQLVVSGEK
jgi:glycosyltransferase involved in cell wall biosynthesis